MAQITVEARTVVRSMANMIMRHGSLRPLIVFAKRRVAEARSLPKMVATGFPRNIFIENTNRCNIHCVMCPREKLSRAQGTMDLGLFSKLAAEIGAHAGTVDRLHLHNFGEPTLDKDLFERIRIAKANGVRHTYFVTNGSLINPERARQIIEAGLDEMKFSFYGTDAETYNRTMVGLDFNKTLANVKTFFSVRKEFGRKNPKVVIQYMEMPSNESKTRDFIRMVEPMLDKSVGDSFYVTPLYNYGTGRSFLRAGEIVRICTFPWHTMVILINGDVVLCAPDYNGEQVVGNVARDTIAGVWNSSACRKVREDFRHFRYRDYPVCRECTVVCDTMEAWND